MDKIEKLQSVAQFNSRRGQKTLHPLISVLDQSLSVPIQANRYLSEVYVVFLKDVKCEEMTYGRNHYDYQEETLIFIAPNQIFGFNLPEDVLVQPSGWALAFHPDFIRGTELGKHIQAYGFFDYHVNEALHISSHERETVLDCLKKIKEELDRGTDKHSKALIINNMELLFNYCVRFYDRQFITRKKINKDILVRFESLLNDYFQSDKPQKIGLPSVAYCAYELHLSSNYFGDLIKKETGKSAQELIQNKVTAIAKEKIIDNRKLISEIAYEIGFKYPSHFTRFFKQQVGQSPNEYRIIGLNSL